jgi:DUF971 family protein
MTDAPTNIRAHQAEQVLELTWPNGSTFRLPYRDLRLGCVCAVCVNEWTNERMIDPTMIRPDLAIEGMEGVGSYAVRFVWNDGHSTGLYTWETLDRLCHAHGTATGHPQ